MVSKEILEARAYLMYVMGQSIESLTAYVNKVGPVRAATAIRAGSAPGGVMEELADREPPQGDLLANRANARLIVPESDEWPTEAFKPLRDRGTEPLGLWVQGDGSLAELADGAIVIVGTGAATEYAMGVASIFGRVLASRGDTIATRSSLGINRHALRGALNRAGKTIMVLDHGINAMIPRQLGTLYRETVARGGLLVSEYGPGTATEPDEHRDLASLRIVAALGAATVVVEASMTSRALHIARAAHEFGRRVFAVPAQIGLTMSAGTNELIREGTATLITDASQVTTEDEGRVVFVVRPDDPLEDVWAFDDNEDAETFRPFCGSSGPVECVPINNEAKAARLIAERRRQEAEDNEDDDIDEIDDDDEIGEDNDIDDDAAPKHVVDFSDYRPGADEAQPGAIS